MVGVEIYDGLQSLLDGIEGRELNEWVACDYSQVDENPMQTTFYIIFEGELSIVIKLENHPIKLAFLYDCFVNSSLCAFGHTASSLPRTRTKILRFLGTLFKFNYYNLDEHLIYEDEERGEIFPIELKDKNLGYWMTIPMIEDVIYVLKRSRVEFDLPLAVGALAYYHKYDAFME